MSSGGLRGLEHPPKVWHKSQHSSYVTTIVTDKQQLVAKTNNNLTGLALNGGFSSLLGLKQPSLSSSCLQERINEGCGQLFGGVAKDFARAICAHSAQHLPSSNPGHAPVDSSYAHSNEHLFDPAECSNVNDHDDRAINRLAMPLK